jgi:hypothetical protein
LNLCLTFDRALIKRLARCGIYFERLRSPENRNASIGNTRYGVFNIQSIDRFTVRHWNNGKVTEELSNGVLVLLEFIFIRYGYFQVTAKKASLHSRSDIIEDSNIIAKLRNANVHATPIVRTNRFRKSIMRYALDNY